MLLGVALIVPTVIIYMELREAVTTEGEPELDALTEGFMEISERFYFWFHTPPARPADFAGFMNIEFAVIALIALALFAYGAKLTMSPAKT